MELQIFLSYGTLEAALCAKIQIIFQHPNPSSNYEVGIRKGSNITYKYEDIL